jgi:hypothetical protein
MPLTVRLLYKGIQMKISAGRNAGAEGLRSWVLTSKFGPVGRMRSWLRKMPFCAFDGDRSNNTQRMMIGSGALINFTARLWRIGSSENGRIYLLAFSLSLSIELRSLWYLGDDSWCRCIFLRTRFNMILIFIWKLYHLRYSIRIGMNSGVFWLIKQQYIYIYIYSRYPWHPSAQGPPRSDDTRQLDHSIHMCQTMQQRVYI